MYTSMYMYIARVQCHVLVNVRSLVIVVTCKKCYDIYDSGIALKSRDKTKKQEHDCACGIDMSAVDG